MFEALPDSALLAELEATRHTGRPGYPLRVVWRALVASFHLGIVHDTDLVRALRSNPTLAAVCGIGGLDEVPSKFAICRFRRKLTRFNGLVGEVLKAATNALRERLPDFGADVAIDATDVKAWANGLHQDTDPDAGTGAKHKSSRRVYWYGYKVHLVADARSELPVWFELSPANKYDGAYLAPALTNAQRAYDWFRPMHVLADKGYDAAESFRFVGEDLGAIPVIDVQKTHMPPPTQQPQPCEAMAVIEDGEIRMRCERRPYERECPTFTYCRWHPKRRRAKPVLGHYTERHSPYAVRSAEWKAVYNQRVSVERVFSRLKTYRKLDAIRVRRFAKVWLHIALSLLAMNAAAVSADDAASVRRCVA